MIVPAEFLAITHFATFSIGFGIGFFYLKHKFESHVAGVMDFAEGDSSDLEGLVQDLDLEGEKQ